MIFKIFNSLLAFILAWGLGSAEAVLSKPNIVVVMTDDLGYGDVSFLNPDSKIQTPHMDALAQSGVFLTDAHSPSSICSPTRYAVLTGRYAWRNPRLRKGVLMPWDEPVINSSDITIPTFLKKAGYTTACIGKWHLGFTWPWKGGTAPDHVRNKAKSIATSDMFDWTQPITGGPLGAGFDTYFGDDMPNFPPYAFIENNRLTCEPVDLLEKDIESIGFRGGIHGNGPGESGWRFDRVMPEITDRAVKYVEAMSAKERPFFLWFATTSPHTPVVPTQEFQGKSQAGHYGDYVVQTDHAVGEIVQALKKGNCFDDTLLIVTSDNGPSPLVQSIIKTHKHQPTGSLRGMKADSWEGGHRVPFIASWPQGGIQGGKRIDDLVSLTDIYALLATVAEVSAVDPTDSVNILPTLLGKGAMRTEMVYHNRFGNLGLRQNQWVLLEGGGGRKEPPWRRDLFGIQSPDAPTQLFDLSADLSQRVNIADQFPEMVRQLHERLQMIEQAPKKH